MPDPTGPFRRSDRLLRSSEFSRVGRGGHRVASRAFVMIVCSRPVGEDEPPQRIGITVSRKVGDAVVRNHVKRRVREWFRASRRKLRSGIDVVVIGRSGAAGLSGREVSGTLCQLAQKARATRG